MSLKSKLKNMFEENRGMAIEIAKKAGFKNATPLYKFLNEPDREMDNFNSLLIIVRELFDNEQRIMADYIVTLDPNKKTARYCLEYLSLNKMVEERKSLIEKMLNCKNLESIEWAKLHQISMLADTGNYTPFELESMFSEIQPKSSEMIVHKGIEIMYCMHDSRNINGVEAYRKRLNIELMKVKDDVLRNVYYVKMILIGMGGCLHTNNVEKIRKYEGIDKFYFPINKAKYLLTLGNSYIFESYDTSMVYLNQALEYAVKSKCEHRIKETKRSINFLCNYYGKEALYLMPNSNDASDIHEVAYSLINKNDPKGLELLESMDLSKATDNSLGFHYYLKGIATKDMKHFFTSIKHFNISGEKFYKFISLQQLRKLGIEDYVLETMAV